MRSSTLRLQTQQFPAISIMGSSRPRYRTVTLQAACRLMLASFCLACLYATPSSKYTKTHIRV